MVKLTLNSKGDTRKIRAEGLLNSGIFSDVVLFCGDNEFKVHKCQLYLAFPDLNLENANCIRVTGCDPVTLWTFLRWTKIEALSKSWTVAKTKRFSMMLFQGCYTLARPWRLTISNPSPNSSAFWAKPLWNWIWMSLRSHLKRKPEHLLRLVQWKMKVS